VAFADIALQERRSDMKDVAMRAQMVHKDGFIPALDQSGGSTPGALRAYGIPDNAYHDDAGMFRLIHEMRVRIMTAPAFISGKVIAAILFERTMDGAVEGQPVPAFLWEKRGIVPFLKIDKGLEAEAGGVRLMKPINDLDALLDRATRLRVFGTKPRSVIRLPSPGGVAAIVAQQLEIAGRVALHGLMPIIEPEILIESADKQPPRRCCWRNSRARSMRCRVTGHSWPSSHFRRSLTPMRA